MKLIKVTTGGRSVKCPPTKNIYFLVNSSLIEYPVSGKFLIYWRSPLHWLEELQRKIPLLSFLGDCLSPQNFPILFINTEHFFEFLGHSNSMLKTGVVVSF